MELDNITYQEQKGSLSRDGLKMILEFWKLYSVGLSCVFVVTSFCHVGGGTVKWRKRANS